MTEEPITDPETVSESGQSFEPHDGDDSKTAVTIVHDGGTEVVSGFTFIEEVDIHKAYAPTCIRVWYSDPAVNDYDYTDYEDGQIVEVTP